jgi:hypothetical protein
MEATEVGRSSLVPRDRKMIWQILKALKAGDSIKREMEDVVRVGGFIE